jgi:DNA transformation protein and related proteins
MAVSDRFLDVVRDALGFVPELRLKKMFGGAGVYSGETVFALAIEDMLFLKADAESAEEFDARGLEPFIFRDRTGREIPMSYRQAPDELWEDPDAAREWVEKAFAAARRKKG